MGRLENVDHVCFKTSNVSPYKYTDVVICIVVCD